MSHRYSFRPMYIDAGGTVNMTALHPTLNTLAVAGDIEGVFISEDYGDHWRIRNRGLYADFFQRVACVAWSTTETNTLYAAVGNEGSGGGFLTSTDGGLTWTMRSTTPQFSGNNNGGVPSLPATHPRSTGNLLAQGGGFIYALTFSSGVYRSNDNGGTWVNIGLSGEYGRSLVQDPSNPDVLYAAVYGNKVYKTSNASAGTPSWAQLTAAPAVVEEMKIVATYLYAACGSSGIYRSIDGGATWDSLNGAFVDTSQSVWQSIDGYVSGTDHVVIAGCKSAITPGGDGARNLVKLTITSGGSVTYADLTTSTASLNRLIPPDNRTWWRDSTSNYKDWITGADFIACHILIDPSDTNRMWVAGTEGIFRTTDGGITWRPAINGLSLSANRRIVADPNHSPSMWVGNVDWTIFEITDGLGQNATTTISHAPTNAGVGYSVAIDALDSRAYIGVGNRDTNTEGQLFSRPYGGSYWIDEGLQNLDTLTNIVTDTFTRTTSDGWGTADTGGAWTLVAGSAASFSVDGSTAKISQTSTSGRGQWLNSINSLDVSGTVDVSWDRLPPSGITHITQVYVRGNGTVNLGYTFRVEQLDTGLTTIRFHRFNGGSALQTGSPVDLTTNYVPGQIMTLRFKAEGTNPTSLYMKAWSGGADAEPTDWMMTTTDSDAALQASGSIGIRCSAGGTFTGTTTYSYDNLHIDSISAGTGDPGVKRPLGIAVGRDGSSNRVVLAALDNSGLWRKVLGSWTKVSAAINASAQVARYTGFIWQAGSAYVYAFDRASGIYRSADYGATWTLIWNITSDTSRTGYIAQDPNVSTELWVSVSTGLYKLSSVQSGTVGSGITSTQITSIASPGALCIDSQGHLYIIDQPTSSVVPPKLMRSVDNGTIWTDISDESFKASANRAIEIALNNKGHIFVVTQNDGILFGYPIGQAQST